MAARKLFRQEPSESRRRGLPAIGFEVSPPEELEVTSLDEGAEIVRCSEQREGTLVGELEVALFAGGLIIDRDGTLEARASKEANAPYGVPVSLPGAQGYRAETVRKGARLPYLYVFAVAPRDLGVDGGLIVRVRSARPAWPAGDQLLGSLRILTRRQTTANDESGPRALPLVGDRDND